MMSIVLLAFSEGCCCCVLWGNDGLNPDLNRPGDPQPRIIPPQGPLGCRCIGSGHLVVEVGRVAHHKKSMRAAGRNPEPLMGIRRQVVAIPCPVSGRAFPEINEDIIDCSGGDPDELALSRLTHLIMQATENMFGGSRVVILNKVKISHKVAEDGLVPGLQEESTGIAEDLRLQQVGVVDFGGELLQNGEG